MEGTLKEGGDRSARTHPPFFCKKKEENRLDRGPKFPQWQTTVLNLEFKPWPLFILVGVPSSHPCHFVVVFFLKYRFRLRLGRDGFFVFLVSFLGILVLGFESGVLICFIRILEIAAYCTVCGLLLMEYYQTFRQVCE